MIGVRGRLVLWNVLAIGAILVAMGVALRMQLRSTLLGQIDSEMLHDIRGVTASHGASNAGQMPAEHSGPAHPRAAQPRADSVNAQFGPADEGRPGTAIIRGRPIDHDAGRIQEYFRDDADEVSLELPAASPRLIPVAEKGRDPLHLAAPIDEGGFLGAARGTRTFHDFRGDGGRMLRSLSDPVRVGGRVIAVVQSYRDIGPLDTQLHHLDLALAALLPLALIVAAVAGSLLVGSAMRPLRKLTDAARSLDPDLSSKRLPISGKDEFAEMANTFNEAFDRTATAFSSQARALKQLERFTGDASHELRTPLGAIKGSVTFLLHGRKWCADTKRSLEIIDHASDRMTSLIADLLLLARQDAGHRPLLTETVSVQQLVRDALALLPNPAEICVQVCVEPDLSVKGDAVMLERSLANLLSNAIRYASSRVRISGSAGDRGVEVVVEDDGQGIAPEHLARVGERFYRPESARSRDQGGTGLGLAIVKSIAEAHGGSFEIRSTVGVGTRAYLRLPA